jgi:hypothetical protein
MIDKTMRKTQVPAYAPLEDGVHCDENRGVLCAFTKTIDIDMDEDDEEDEDE